MRKSWTTKTATGIVNVHSRWTAGTIQRAAEILDGLAIPGESVWPSCRWPALVLDHGFAVGSRGGHGFIRYTVVDHEPGRSVSFVFDDSMPLAGGHRFEIAPDGEGVQWTHTLVIDEPSLAARRIIVPLHDALLEDLLDLVVGQMTHQPVRPRAQSTGLRLTMSAARWSRKRHVKERSTAARTSADIASVLLLAVGALHAAWASGVVWPGKDREDLARRVISSGELPGAVPCVVVAGLLGCAAVVTQAGVRTAGPFGAIPYPIADTATATASGVLALRGIVGLATACWGRRTRSPFRELDAALYSPFCVGVAALLARSRVR